MNDLYGRTALVTGAGRGFGKAIAIALAGAGAGVTLVARRSAEIASVADEIQQLGGHAIAVSGDLRDLDNVLRVYQSHVAEYGVPDILVNCAGVGGPIAPIGQLNIEHWWEIFQINLLASTALMNVAIPDMQNKNRGCIINVASLAATLVLPCVSGYCVAKAAMYKITEHVAAENKNTGVVAFAVHPGDVNTEMAEAVINSAEARRWVPEFVAMFDERKASGGGIQDLPRCGARCVELASGRYDYLSGQFLDFSHDLPDKNLPIQSANIS